MKLTTNLFIQKAKQIHNEKFDYSKSLIINLKSKILLTCNTCKTEFLQRADHHLNGHGCKICNKRKTKVTQDSFIIEAKKIHNLKYDYSLVNFINMKTPIKLICDYKHIFEQTPERHLQGRGCSLCNKRTVNKHTKESFIKQAKLKHKYYLYNYTLVEYINNDTKVKIICPIHGQFEQLPRSHLTGTGCKKCKTIGWSKSDFIKKFNKIPCTFYLLKCFNNNETFYKIGITSKTVKQRYTGSMPYDFELIFEIKDTAKNIWELEEKFKKELTSTYLPNIAFGGSKTECFSDVTLLLNWKNNLCNTQGLDN